MKKFIFLEILRELQQKPNLMRKVKIFAALGLVVVVVMGGLLIWAGVSAVNYVATKANQVAQSPATQAQLSQVQSEIKSLKNINALNCWDQAQSLMGVRPWLERPVADNLHDLKAACLEQKPPACEGAECERQNKPAEG